jgi:hypothetical protein
MLQQFIMEQTFGPYEPYVDDVTVGDDDFEMHLSRLRDVFERAAKANFKFGLSKCHFNVDPLEILGRICSGESHEAAPAHIANIRDAAVPRTVKELLHFLGVVNWIREYIPDPSRVMSGVYDQLTRAQRSGVSKLVYTETDLAQFQLLKQVASQPIRLYPINYECPIYVRTDASMMGWAGIIFQLNEDGSKRICEIASGRFNPVQRRWNTTEQEAYGIYRTITDNEKWLLGHYFYLTTDHEALTWADYPAMQYIRESPNRKVARWYMGMQWYRFETKHIKGIENGETDQLSRVATIEDVASTGVCAAPVVSPLTLTDQTLTPSLTC